MTTGSVPTRLIGLDAADRSRLFYARLDQIGVAFAGVVDPKSPAMFQAP